MKRSANLLLVAFLCTILQPGNGYSQSLVGGPIAHWKLDSPTGSVFAEDATGNFRGTLSTNGASFVPGGITGNAINITRAGNGHIAMGDVLALTNINFTISAWVKTQPGDQSTETVFVSRHIEGSNNGYFLGDNRHTILIGQPGKALLFAGGTNAAPTSTNNVNDGNWHHVVGVQQLNGTQQIFVDGVLESTVTVTSPMVPSAGDFFLGAVESDTGAPESRYNGLLDEVQIYDRALSASEVMFLARNPGLVIDNTPGNTDFGFDPVAGFANVGVQPVVINKIISLSNSNLLVGGSFANYMGFSTPNLAMIQPDASLAPDFFHGFGAAARVNDMAIQSDNKIVVVGAFDAFHEVFSYRIARITAEGHPDRSFRPGGGADVEIHAVDLQSDGRIVIGGSFNSYDATNRARIARLLSNGKLDTSFDPGTGFNGTILDVVALSNGQTLAAGNFVSFNGFTVSGLVRLNADGSLDTTFVSPFEATAIVNELLLDPDGKIVAVGDFDLTGANGRRNVARLNADGTLDVNFGSNSFSAGGNGAVNAVGRCSDGTYVVGGEFGQFDGVVRSRLAKLSTNGLLDNPPLFLSVPQLVTNTVVITNMVTVINTNIGTTTNVFGYISNLVFIPLTTNVPPTPAQTSFVTSNQVSSTVNVISGQNPAANYFGLLGGANGSVQSIAMSAGNEPVIGGAFTMVGGLTRNGFARLSPCVPQNPTPIGPIVTLSGTISDAVNSQPLAGVTITSPIASGTSTLLGTFTFNGLTLGTNNVVFSLPGYATFTNQIIVANTQPLTTTIGLSPSITDTNTIRLVMSWGAQPDILDSHLNVPAIFGNPPIEIAYTNLGNLLNPPFAALDRDAVTGFGPETITITNTFPGIYSYWIQDFSSFTSLQPTTFPGNGATVEVFTHEGQILTLTPPSGTGHYWHVLQFNGTNKTWAIVNSLSNSIPLINTSLVYSNLTGGTFTGPSIGPPGPPRIDVQPKDQFELVGNTAQLSAGVSGTLPFSFQWYHNGNPLAGETSATLTLPNLTVATGGDYHLVITNTLGRATSVVAQVAAFSSTAPFVFLQPENISVDIGGVAAFEVIA
ncbi:MAG: LamG-like jellyroll fold domain-containing protein, partial [Limisphaerales bacterium]